MLKVRHQAAVSAFLGVYVKELCFHSLTFLLRGFGGYLVQAVTGCVYMQQVQVFACAGCDEACISPTAVTGPAADLMVYIYIGLFSRSLGD